MPLPNTASYEEILTELRALTGINQKFELAATLGSPSVVTDSVSTSVNNLWHRKDTLATLLARKGQPSTPDEPLNILVNRVNDIDLGMKFATGTGSASGRYATITGLPFKPKYILFELTAYGAGARAIWADPALGWSTTSNSNMVGSSVTLEWNITADGFECGLYAHNQRSYKYLCWG